MDHPISNEKLDIKQMIRVMSCDSRFNVIDLKFKGIDWRHEKRGRKKECEGEAEREKERKRGRRECQNFSAIKRNFFGNIGFRHRNSRS